MKHLFSAFLIMATLLVSVPAMAADDRDSVSGDKATDMTVDLIVARPLGVVATILGTVLTVVALPFTLPSGSVGSSAQEWIVKPAEYTFNRPLGDFHHCGEDRHPCGITDR